MVMNAYLSGLLQWSSAKTNTVWCVLQVKAAEELERGQRITEEKKHAVHDELVRKAKAQEVRGCDSEACSECVAVY